MKKIGITGGIGSGKTTVCRVFELLGVPVYYSDQESKNILASDKSIRIKLLENFSNNILDADDLIDRKKLASLVFNNKIALEQLNSILHPAVGKHFEEWLKHQKSPYIIKEAAILFESGAYKQVDKVIAVIAPLELRLARLLKRDQNSREEIQQRIEKQMSDEERIKRSDVVLVNDEQELLIPQVVKLHQSFLC
ncbi:MAG: dephospho-CoA kinase [Bacteroidetes bacterium]|nr:dephospho-CoA kinase [Bacteroidota bacterium]